MPTLAPAPAILTAAAIALLPSASASAAEMPVARCSIHQLRVHAEGSGIAAGSELSEFAFVNRGARACRLFGYPRLTMLGRAGRALKTSDRNAPPGFDGVREGVVTLGAGAQAWCGVYYADRTGYGTPTHACAPAPRVTTPSRTPSKPGGAFRSLVLSARPARPSIVRRGYPNSRQARAPRLTNANSESSLPAAMPDPSA